MTPELSIEPAAGDDLPRLTGIAAFVAERSGIAEPATLARAVAQVVLAESPTSRTVRVRIGDAAASATAGDVPVGHEVQAFGQVDILFEQPDVGVYRLRIAPGRSIDTHVHRALEEHELVLGTGLLLQDRPVAPGMAHSWPHDFPHRYHNPTATEQCLLCIDRPAFYASDEVAVPPPATGLQPVDGRRFFEVGP